ncbi:MAG: hypothetical protein HPY76_09015 [Anaerolineae bacterium]|jgi:hypothetical protein|nr:hypothetical protein [Anaerolineae bacterium]
MREILEFLSISELPIYLILGVLAIISAQRMITAWREWRSSIFGLEKEHAQRRFSTATSLLVLIVSIILVVFILVSFVYPGLPVVVSLETPTMDILSDRTETAQAMMPGDPTILAVGTTIPSNGSEGCIPTQIEWLYPANGDEISGTVELKGTVNIPAFGFYKYEFSQVGSETWTTIAAGNQPRYEEIIGVWNTEALIPGDYLLRLVVTDSSNQTLPACTVNVTVEAP